MINHVISVRNRNINVSDYRIIANNINTDTFSLDLDSEWSGLNVVVQFECETPILVRYVGGMVNFPSSLLADVNDYISLTVLGYDQEGNKRLVTAKCDMAFRVVDSGCVIQDDPYPEYPDLLHQLVASGQAADDAAGLALDAANKANDAAANIDEVVSDLGDTAANAAAAKESAAAAASSATAAAASEAAARTSETAAADSAKAAKQSATSVADKFISSAQATTLEPGSQATVSVEDQVLQLGIPQGDKGDKGDPGSDGADGKSVNIHGGIYKVTDLPDFDSTPVNDAFIVNDYEESEDYRYDLYIRGLEPVVAEDGGPWTVVEDWQGMPGFSMRYLLVGEIDKLTPLQVSEADVPTTFSPSAHMCDGDLVIDLHGTLGVVGSVTDNNGYVTVTYVAKLQIEWGDILDKPSDLVHTADLTAAIQAEASAREKADQLLEDDVESKLDAADLVAGTNITISADPETGHVTISATGGGGGGGDYPGSASDPDFQAYMGY